jgi:hypothetical protein
MKNITVTLVCSNCKQREYIILKHPYPTLAIQKRELEPVIMKHITCNFIIEIDTTGE